MSWLLAYALQLAEHICPSRNNGVSDGIDSRLGYMNPSVAQHQPECCFRTYKLHELLAWIAFLDIYVCFNGAILIMVDAFERCCLGNVRQLARV